MSENHKEEKMAPLCGLERNFSCINKEEDDQVIYLSHCDGGSEGTTITIVLVEENSYGGF